MLGRCHGNVLCGDDVHNVPATGSTHKLRRRRPRPWRERNGWTEDQDGDESSCDSLKMTSPGSPLSVRVWGREGYIRMRGSAGPQARVLFLNSMLS